MSIPTEERTYRIGELAELAGVTTRTIRYYEELGLLGCRADRAKGGHRHYTELDALRLRELIRLRDLLGLTLEELRELAEAEEVRASLRERWHGDPSDEARLQVLDQAVPLVERQLALVRARQQTLAEFARELETKLRSLKQERRRLAGR